MKRLLAPSRITMLAILLAAHPLVHAQASGADPATTGTPAPKPFEELDTNADGAISKDEAAADPALVQLFGTLDKDADGRLTAEEYADYVPLATD